LKEISIYDRMTKAEKEVAGFLNNLGIYWSYENPIFVWDESNRPRVWAPDFLLIPFGIYVEVCGSDKFNYEYRRSILENNGFKVIFLHLYKESSKWKNHLMVYLERIIDYRNQKLNEILRKNIEWLE